MILLTFDLCFDWQVDWFQSTDISNFVIHIIGWTTSPGCMHPQEYSEQGGIGVWRPIIPNNALLATSISLVRLHLTTQYTIHILP